MIEERTRLDRDLQACLAAAIAEDQPLGAILRREDGGLEALSARLVALAGAEDLDAPVAGSRRSAAEDLRTLWAEWTKSEMVCKNGTPRSGLRPVRAHFDAR